MCVTYKDINMKTQILKVLDNDEFKELITDYVNKKCDGRRRYESYQIDDLFLKESGDLLIAFEVNKKHLKKE